MVCPKVLFPPNFIILQEVLNSLALPATLRAGIAQRGLGKPCLHHSQRCLINSRTFQSQMGRGPSTAGRLRAAAAEPQRRRAVGCSMQLWTAADPVSSR